MSHFVWFFVHFDKLIHWSPGPLYPPSLCKNKLASLKATLVRNYNPASR